MTSNHLMAVVLYTDFTELSSHFTATFRKNNPFETVEQVKKRNNKYWWWSKYLQETTEEYGVMYTDRSPFFTGMSWVMTVPEFNIILHSPTSTSIYLSVATKFCGEDGMILEFDNTKGEAIRVPWFDCSWISRYREEDEMYDKFLNS